MMGMLGFWFGFPAASGRFTTAGGWFPLGGTSVTDGLALINCVANVMCWLVCSGDWPTGRVMLIQLVFVRC